MKRIFYIVVSTLIILPTYEFKKDSLGFWFVLAFWAASVVVCVLTLLEGRTSTTATPDPEAAQRIENLRIKLEQDKIASLTDLVQEHASTLARKHMISVKKDDYGIEDRSAWTAEVDYFINKVVTPKLGQLDPNHRQLLIGLINEAASAGADKFRAARQVECLTPLEFELWCSQVLKELGWQVRTTKTTGDQGADIVAEKDGKSLVIQCKLYSAPVGNKAVQEAYSAQRHYAARASAVVTNAGFTRSAQELAASTGVILMHHSQLETVDDLLVEYGFSQSKRSYLPSAAVREDSPHPNLTDLAARIAAAKSRLR
ncbi:restriction endonuclease [Methylorubrum sp. POS3]|uniref:restriction endonuclease n=1 Tax=Methylorubrum sp. POS3 TaxID=2998492 RepID=UPI00372A311E